MKTGHKDHLLSTSAKSSEKLTFPKPLTRKDASVLKIKEARNSSDCFSFKLVTIEDICKEIRALDASKATQSDDIPTKTVKNNSDIFSRFFQVNFDNAIETSTFPEQLKYADVKPVFKKDSRTDKKNYRPISILPNVSKIYERCINNQLEEYFQALLSKYQCGFRKGYSVINAILPMIEKYKISRRRWCVWSSAN